MRLITFGLLSIFLALCGAKNLLLSEQELRFAGSALRTVLATNANSYHGKRGSRRFTGSFTIVERECGNLDIRINADVELQANNGNRVRVTENVSGNKNFGNGGYAGQFNY